MTSCMLEVVEWSTIVLQFASYGSDGVVVNNEAFFCKSWTRGLLVALVRVRCIWRLIFPFSSILRASGEASRRLPNVGTPVDLCSVGVFG